MYGSRAEGGALLGLKANDMKRAWVVFPNGAPFTVDGKVLGKPYRYRLAKVLPRKKLYRSRTVNGRGLAYRSGISTVGFQRCPYRIDKAASLINHEPRR